MKLPLGTLRILDLTHHVAGPAATDLLGLLGAECIKVEPTIAPMARDAAGRVAPGYQGDRPYNALSLFNQYNNNRLSVSLNLATPRGATLFKDLVKISDAVVENFAPGVMERFGLGYQELALVKPDIILCSIPGFGQGGPWSDYRGYAVCIEPLVGMFSLTGYPGGEPMKSGCDHLDPVHGTHAAGAILAALLHRHRTGRGQFIEISHLESAVAFVGQALMEYSMNRRVPTRQGNDCSTYAPHNAYRCKGEDKWVAIAVTNDEEWGRFCRAIGNPPWTEEERFADALSRWQNRRELDRLVASWTQEREHYEVMAILQQAGVAAGAILDVAEVLANPHLRARGFFEPVYHPEAGEYPFIGPPWQMGETPLRVRRPAPCYAEHNQYVYGELLGLTHQEIADLLEEGVITTEPVPAKRPSVAHR